jgi:hypothetical protein
VVEQVVAHLVEERVGVEVEAALRPVPSRVPKPALGTIPSPPPKRHRFTVYAPHADES